MAWLADFAAGARLRASVLNSKFFEVRPLGAIKTVDESLDTSTTLQDDGELFVPVEANTRYALTGFILFSSGTTPDFKMDLDLPTSATHWTTAATWSNAAAAGSQLADTRTFTTGASIGIPGQGTTLTTQGQLVVLVGSIKVEGTAGNVQVRWAQNTSDAGTTTVYAKSWIELRRLV